MDKHLITPAVAAGEMSRLLGLRDVTCEQTSVKDRIELRFSLRGVHHYIIPVPPSALALSLDDFSAQHLRRRAPFVAASWQKHGSRR